MVKIAPSILSADFSVLGDQVRRAVRAGADLIHIDVMDGHFVPNLTIGPDVVRSIRPLTDIPFDAHLMVRHPDRFVGAFVDAGADDLTVHVEADHDVMRTIRAIRDAGAKPGVVVNPPTPLESALPFLEHVDLVLIMTVNPGRSGQGFIEDVLPKVSAARRHVQTEGLAVEIEVDGGIKPGNAGRVAAAGADILVAGSAIFPEDVEARLKALRTAAGG